MKAGLLEIGFVVNGPEGKLYGTTLNGEIRRRPLNPDGTTGPVEIRSSLRTAEGGDQLLIGSSSTHPQNRPVLFDANGLPAWIIE